MIKFSSSNYSSFYINKDDFLKTYFSDIRKLPLLSEKEEKELLYVYKNSQTKTERENAKNKLIEGNLRFVVSVAKKMGNKDNILDLIEEGNVGLIKAIENFDITKNVKLITYAVSWIIVHIQKYIMTQQTLVSQPNAMKMNHYTNNVTQQFLKENERMPTQEEVAEIIKEKFNYDVTSIEDVNLTRSISIEENFGLTENETFETSDKYISRTKSNNIQDEIEKEYKSHKINCFFSKLDNREKQIVEKYYGFGCTPQSYEYIAKDIGITSERCRQICLTAIKKGKEFFRNG